MPNSLFPGLYDSLKTAELAATIERSGLSEYSEVLPDELSHERLSSFFMQQLSLMLSGISGPRKEKVLAQAELINELLTHLRAKLKDAQNQTELVTPPTVVRSLYRGGNKPELPNIGLAQPWLFTAGKDSPALLNELQAELASCDQVDILISFITVSGVRKIIDTLKRITSTDAAGRSQTHIRVLTTTYVGATEQKALDMFASLPNTEVRVSLDGRRTRLHAKAWIFQRNSGFGSAYVGSANLSGAALMGGLEWTVKFTEKGQANLFNRAQAHFETLWEDGEFQVYHPDNLEHRKTLELALKRESGRDYVPFNMTFLSVEPKPFQQEILEQLEAERSLGRHRNLLVAATGTGKTVMAAFDYRRLCRQQGGRPRLLFVAHRVEILRQALFVYRQVLNDNSFGELLTGDHQPNSHEHLFASIFTISSRELQQEMGVGYWHTVVIDECHHIKASNFERFVTTIKPKILLGLTATPERADGKNILQHFDNRPDGTPAVQLRLWQALDLQLLCPFEYYACDDDTDLRSVPWRHPNETAVLGQLVTGNHARARSIIRAWDNLVTDPRQCKTLAFCVNVAHAEFMAEQFNTAGIIARVITGETPRQERIDIPQQLERGEIHVIVSVDIFNEGVDLPFIDTLLLLRPTQSATVFQQQIGRGLRLHENKQSCLILDFVGQHAAGFRFDLLYSAITGLSKREVLDGVENGFGRLPSGCHIQLQKHAREQILANLQLALNQNWRRLQQELHAYSSIQGSQRIDLNDFLHDQQLDLEDIYRIGNGDKSGWTNLQREAGLLQQSASPEESYFSRRFSSLLHIDDSQQLELIRKVSEQRGEYSVCSEEEALRLQMLAYQIDGQTSQTGPAESFLKRLSASGPVCEELAQLSDHLLGRVNHVFQPLTGLEYTPLKLHSAYQQREILTAVKFFTAEKRVPFRAGVLLLKDIKTELLFVTLDKSGASHEGVAYDDYAISSQLFHWQSQNSAAPHTAGGKRYLESPQNGWRFQLFVRVDKTSPYYACGPVTLHKHHGEKPMNITWKLENSLPMRLFQKFSVLQG